MTAIPDLYRSETKKLKTLTDPSELLLRISEGDERAYAVFFEHYYARLRPFVIKFTKSETDAEEVLQETFVRVWLYRDRIAQVENPDVWIRKVASRECLSFLRRNLSDRKSLTDISDNQDFTDQSSQTPHEMLDLDEVHSLIRRAVEKMPAQRRKIYQLSRDEGLKPAEIAEKLGLSVSTVKNVLSASLKEIRTFLIASDVDLGTFVWAMLYFCK